MPSTRSGTGKAAGRTTTGREGKTLTFDQHVAQLKRAEPHLFDASNFDAYIVAQALNESGALDHENIKLQTAEYMLARLASRYVSDFPTPVRRAARPPAADLPQVGNLAKRLLGVLHADMMIDGKRLGDYTFGQLRKEVRGFTDFLQQFADVADDELVGKYLK